MAAAAEVAPTWKVAAVGAAIVTAGLFVVPLLLRWLTASLTGSTASWTWTSVGIRLGLAYALSFAAVALIHTLRRSGRDRTR